MDGRVLRFAAFTDDSAGGNPAGVVLDAPGLDGAGMLRIAAEVGYSETAFVIDGDTGRRRYRLRYFSPRGEVAFCGHATIATAVALAHRDGPGRLVFDTAAGAVPVTVAGWGGVTRATLTSVPTRSRPAAPADVAAALAALRWAPGDIDGMDARFPPHVAFAGNDHLMLAAATRQRLADLDYDVPALGALMGRAGWTTVHLFWAERADRFHARDPFPVGGVAEDPATGSAAAAFGGYLRALGRVTGPTRLTIRQGEDLGRPGELTVDVDPADARVRVTGQAVPIG
ncbi:MAG TPA: PhzF family phenazine biosynthesis isomerase [Mycobacteriales bacterium]|nr:PhzF family phenazine biosynthesis isomerase [Mycobacteriales bacterium]